MDLKQAVNDISVKINNLGTVRVLKNDLLMLNYHRKSCSGNPTVTADYDNRILAKRWKLQECKELERERDAIGRSKTHKNN